MTLHGIDLVAIAATIVGGLSVAYLLLLRRLRVILADRQMQTADQIGKLDDAIRALETRLAQHQLQAIALEQSRIASNAENLAEAEQGGSLEEHSEKSPEIVPEIQAAIAAAAVATLGPNAVVHSMKSVPSPWTQQGRVLIQGGHNIRVQR